MFRHHAPSIPTTLCILFVSALTAWSAPPAHYMVQAVAPVTAAQALTHSSPAGVFADGLDDDNTVVGAYAVGHSFVAAILFPTPTVLGTLATDDLSQAHAIHAGEIVGDSTNTTTTGLPHAFRYTVSLGLQDVGLSVFLSVAQAIHHGVKGGFCVPVGESGGRPCAFTNDGQAHLLATLGGRDGTVEAVSPTNLLGGASQIASGPQHATVWMLEIPYDFHPPGASSSSVSALSAQNVVAINSSIPGQGQQAWQWSATKGFERLRPLAGQARSQVWGVNAEGLKVGRSGNDDGVRWLDDTTVQALTPLVANGAWQVYNATAINEAGVILAFATYQGVQDYVVLLIPVEPFMAFTRPPRSVHAKQAH